jgi:ABC-type polysaccharide/polyol phosphate export permease
MLTNYFKGIWQDRYILSSFVSKDLKQKYRRSKLGIAWSVLTPLGLVLIIGLVYGVLFQVSMREFVPFLFSGINPWMFYAGCADGGTQTIIGAEGYIKQTTVNVQVFIIRPVLVNFVNFLYAEFAFFVVYFFVSPELFSFSMLAVIPGLAIILVFCIGVSTITGVAQLYLRDFALLQSLMIQGLFYATPVIYNKATMFDRGMAWVYQLNPLYYMLEVCRAPILGETIPPMRVWLVAAGIAAAAFLLGVVLLMKNKDTIAFKF